MKPKCKNCGKVLQEEGRAYCKECREQTEKLILNRIDAAYREIRQLTNRLREVSDEGIRLSQLDTRVLVHDGIVDLADLLGEEIQVANHESDYGIDMYVWFKHGDLTYETFDKSSEPRGKAILEKWEATHGTFY